MQDRNTQLDGRLVPLVDELEHTEKMYSTAAGNALDDRLRQLFEARAEQRENFAQVLRQRSWAVDEEDEDGGGPLEVLQRGGMTIKATMTIEPDKTDQVLIEDTREADEALLEQYRKLLGQDGLEPGLQRTLKRQYALVEAAQANLNTLLGAPDRQMALALFPTVEQAQQAVRQLEESGFGRENIDLLAQEEAVKDLIEDPRPETTRESAAAGAVGGGAVGGLIGLVAGASTAMIMGVGTVLTGGALAAAIGITAAGAGIGASYGGLLGALMGWGVSEGDIQHFIEGVRDGNILVAVQTEHQRSQEAVEIMRAAGATHASAHQEDDEA